MHKLLSVQSPILPCGRKLQLSGVSRQVVTTATRETCLVVTLILTIMLSASCRRSKNVGPWDGGTPELREECKAPGEACYRECYKRDASPACVACCADQDVYCNTQQPYSFEGCSGTP